MNDQELFNEIMADYEAQIEAENREYDRVNSRIMKAILSVRGSAFHECVRRFLEDNEPNGSMSLSKKPYGKKQIEQYGRIRTIWVDQYHAGEDSYYGNQFIKLKDHLYLKIPFEC